MAELNSDQRQQIMSALEGKDKLLAIKLYREATSCSIGAAKEFVDQLQVALETGEAPQSSEAFGLSDDALHQVLDLMKQGQKIPAIKVYREHMQTGLREAKEAVEAIAANNGIQATKSGCAATVLALCSGMVVLVLLYA